MSSSSGRRGGRSNRGVVGATMPRAKFEMAAFESLSIVVYPAATARAMAASSASVELSARTEAAALTQGDSALLPAKVTTLNA